VRSKGINLISLK